MKDSECVQFLQWALPRMHMRWSGFRKVRAQVCKRITRRMHQLDIDGIAAYRAYLQQYPQEWDTLDALSRVTISRFYRNKAVFEFLQSDVFPSLVLQAADRRLHCLRVWSVGSCSGEEPYTIALLWRIRLRSQFPHVRLEIIATEADPSMNQRAKAACYRYGSIRDLPAEWCNNTFEKQDNVFCLKPEYRENVQFITQDVRKQRPPGLFDLVLCRNLVFTYFSEALQSEVLDRIYEVMQPGGALVIGGHEQLPENNKAFNAWSDRLRIFRKDDERDKPDE